MINQLVFMLIFVFLFLSHGTVNAFEVSASSSIKPSAVFSYEPNKVIDRNMNTAWCSNKRITSSLWIKINYPRPTQISGFGIINGYARNKTAYKNNSKPKVITISYDNKLLTHATLKDSNMPQWVEFNRVNGLNFEILIDEIFTGLKSDDVCITEIFTDRRIIDGFKLIEIIDRNYGGRALTPAEIKNNIKPLYDALYHPLNNINGRDDIDAFWDTISLRASKLDIRGLRFLLDLTYYAENYRSGIDAELLEGLRDMIIPFIQFNKSAVIEVINDKKQVERARIASAFDIYDPAQSGYQGEQLKQEVHKIEELGKYIENIRNLKK